MTARRRGTFVAGPKDYTPQNLPVAPFVAAIAAVVFLLAVAASLIVLAVVTS